MPNPNDTPNHDAEVNKKQTEKSHEEYPCDPENCRCDVHTVTWDHNNAFTDEHQHVIPGTCRDCGRDIQYVYTESGLRDTETREYIREF